MVPNRVYDPILPRRGPRAKCNNAPVPLLHFEQPRDGRNLLTELVLQIKSTEAFRLEDEARHQGRRQSGRALRSDDIEAD
jgi:hypothetical protein